MVFGVYFVPDLEGNGRRRLVGQACLTFPPLNPIFLKSERYPEIAPLLLLSFNDAIFGCW